MSKRPGVRRTVQCYMCRERFEVSAKAMTVSCPGCHKPLLVQDVVVRGVQSVTKLQTCGKIVVQPKGRVIAELVEAHAGVDMRGSLDAKLVRGGPVHIGAKAKWRGDCRTLSLTIDAGAQVTGGQFETPNDELGLSSLPE